MNLAHLNRYFFWHEEGPISIKERKFHSLQVTRTAGLRNDRTRTKQFGELEGLTFNPPTPSNQKKTLGFLGSDLNTKRHNVHSTETTLKNRRHGKEQQTTSRLSISRIIHIVNLRVSRRQQKRRIGVLLLNHHPTSTGKQELHSLHNLPLHLRSV